MDKSHIFSFKTDVSGVPIPDVLNNPFGHYVPEIARLAAAEFQDYIALVSQQWEHDFSIQRGKMFGVLVVQKCDESLVYLGTVSGKLQGTSVCENFVPSVFDESTDDFFINRGMRELTEIGDVIKASSDDDEIKHLKEERKLKSWALQQRLFENYRFRNIHGAEVDLLKIFEQSSHGNPPAAAGECAAPKLLQYALENALKPIAVAEFWWGNPPKNNERNHKGFYPACKNKCRPILEYMLDDTKLYSQIHNTVV